MRSNHRLWVGAVVASCALTVTACGSDQGSEAAEGDGTARAGSDMRAPAGATEAASAEPRLIATDAKTGRIDILDLASARSIDSVTVDNPAKVTMVDNRYAFAVDGPGGHVTILDAGSWTVDHGDHTHSYVADPKKIGTLDGTKPAHIVPGDGKVAAFFDGDGEARVLDQESLGNGDTQPSATIEADAPHHGVVAPIAGHYLTSHSVETPGDTRPGSFELRDSEGKKVQDFDTACPRMHGEAVFDDRFVAACDDGVFLVTVHDGAWDSEKIAYPQGIGTDTRPTTFREQENVSVLAATAGPAATNDGVLLFDSATKQWRRLETPARALNVHLSGDGRSAFAILADGTFHVYDTTTGAETAAAPVLARPYNWSDTAATPPVIAVAGARAYVSDPAAGVIKEIDYADGARVARTIDVGMPVSSLGVAGL